MSRLSAADFTAGLERRGIPTTLAGLELTSWTLGNLQKAVKECGGKKYKPGTSKMELCEQLGELKPNGFGHDNFKQREWRELRRLTKAKLLAKSVVTKAAQNKTALKKSNLGTSGHSTARCRPATTTFNRTTYLHNDFDEERDDFEEDEPGLDMYSDSGDLNDHHANEFGDEDEIDNAEEGSDYLLARATFNWNAFDNVANRQFYVLNAPRLDPPQNAFHNQVFRGLVNIFNGPTANAPVNTGPETATCNPFRPATLKPAGFNFPTFNSGPFARFAPDPAAQPAAQSAGEDERNCMVCFKELTFATEPTRRITTACAHRETLICQGCVRNSITAQASSKSLENITCLVPDCNAVLQHEDLRLFTSQEIFNRFDTFLTQRALAVLPGYVSCSNSACKNGGFIDEVTDSFFTCSSCHTRTCVQCKTVNHPDISCGHNQRNLAPAEPTTTRRQRQQDERVSERLVNTIAKQCPGMGCGARIEKNNGCNHMTRSHCRHEFCWVCMAPYGPIREDGNHRHRRTCEHYAAVDYQRRRRFDDDEDAIY